MWRIVLIGLGFAVTNRYSRNTSSGMMIHSTHPARDSSVHPILNRPLLSAPAGRTDAD